MKLKILIAPLVAAAVVIALIWVIVPQFMDMRGKMKQLEESNAKLDDIKEKNTQAERLSRELEGSFEKKGVIMKFVPAAKKEEEIIDNLNYYASDGGLAIYNLGISRVKQAPVEEEKAARTFFSSIAGGDKQSPGESKEMTKDFSVPQNLEVELGVTGSYERIKEFFIKISKLARYNSINSLQISVAPDEKSEDLTAEKNTEVQLQANAIFIFNYLEKSDNAVINVDNKIFSSEKFDMSAADDIQNKMETSVLKLEAGEMGRNNPFMEPSK